MGRKGAQRTAKQKAADKRASQRMKGKGVGGKSRSRSSSSSSSGRRTRRAPKKTWGGAAAKVGQVVLVANGVRGAVQNYKEARNASWGVPDSLVYAGTGVRKLSGQISGEVKPGLGDGQSVDYKAAARSPLVNFTAAKEGPKVVAKVGKAITPANLRHTRVMGRRIAH
jgi:hypothetical protein